MKKRTLNDIVERLNKDNIVNINLYECMEEIAINENYFIYDNEGNSDLYFIRITIENNKYVAYNNFCDGDFLDRYDNQEKYINAVIKEMNERE